MTSTDIHRLLVEQGSHTSKTTVHKVIDTAGFTGGAPKHGQMIRDVNKENRMTFCKTLIAKNDSLNDIIFTDECSVQLHGNKIVVYREKDPPAPIIPKPKHPLKVHVWVGISRKGSTGIVVFDGIMTSSYYTETILTHGLLPFIQKVYPNGHRFQQDNDPKHISKATQQFMRENDINWWNVWPSESGFPSHKNGVGHDEETIGEKRNKDKRSTTSLHSTVLDMTVELCNQFIDHNLQSIVTCVY